ALAGWLVSFAMRAYARAPVWTQNLLLTAYGIRLRRLRYGRTGRETLARLRQSQWLPEQDVLASQLLALSELVGRAAADVPFYRARGLERINFSSVAQLSE